MLEFQDQDFEKLKQLNSVQLVLFTLITVHEKEFYLLKLIYADLGSRIV